jgi:hypothetical protein
MKLTKDTAQEITNTISQLVRLEIELNSMKNDINEKIDKALDNELIRDQNIIFKTQELIHKTKEYIYNNFIA